MWEKLLTNVEHYKFWRKKIFQIEHFPKWTFYKIENIFFTNHGIKLDFFTKFSPNESMQKVRVKIENVFDAVSRRTFSVLFDIPIPSRFAFLHFLYSLGFYHFLAFFVRHCWGKERYFYNYSDLIARLVAVIMLLYKNKCTDCSFAKLL
jgi:hypothetical protein